MSAPFNQKCDRDRRVGSGPDDQATGDRPRVLVVDGDDNVLRLLEIKLSRAGYCVSTADDGEQGYLAARLGPADLVIAGDALGPLDSHSLVRALAGLPDPPAVVFLSACAADSDIERALHAGCDDYVLKPFSPHELVHRVGVTLARRRLRDGRPPE